MKIEVPALGESITEAVISSWLIAEGEYVNDGDEIVELETDKVTMPLPSPGSGVLKYTVEEGDTVEVGAVIAELDESGAPAAKPTTKEESKAEASPAESAAPAAKAEAPKQKPAPQPAAAAPAPAASGDVRATPVAEKLAGELGVTLSTVRGTGPGGRIREQDVLAASHAPSNGSASSNGHAPAPASLGPGEIRRERMSQLRQRIATRLVEAQHTAAMLTTFNECDMTNVMALRSRMKDAFLEKHNTKLGFMSFFVKACVSALNRVPSVGAFIVEGAKGPELEYHDDADIAVAVGTDKGLVVPVLRQANRLSFAGVESGILDLAKKARDGKLTLEDMTGGNFTISNGGVYGSMLSTPILNAPQSGILGMHNIIKRPVEHPDKPGEVAIRPMMYLALSYDHRVVDGEGAVTFLKTVKECIEDPERIMLEL
ncbi:MAG: 2-oxoglutarate dehydrogenase complex dihydrolipoyllysine-residue succinyltransferase [Planctomycetota bacterium]